MYGHPASARRATAGRGRKLSALLVALLFAASGAAQAKIITALTPSLFDVTKAIGSAVDGDTVIIPAGTATWTAKLAITKGITLKGQTTVAGAGTISPTATDLTIIKDDTPATGPIIRVTSNAFFKMVGLTFVPGTRTTIGSAEGAIQLAGGANGVPATAQIEQCHFNKILQTRLVLLGKWTYGVFDNNFAELTSTQNAFLIRMSAYAYNGVPQTLGHGAFADYPWYGTDKFFFIETNTFLRNSPSGAMIRGLTDGDNGCRFVVRYNYIRNAPIFDHGTEGATRGGRAFEVYNNTCNFTVPRNGPAVGWRSGTSLIHDNLVTVASGISYGTPGIICGLSEYRETAFHPGTPWGEADGTSVWDKNVTNCGANPLDKSQQTFVKGNAPYVFDSGKDDSSINSAGVMHDSTKHWTTNQWVGYSITNYGSAYQRLPTHSIGSYIISNTNNTITYKFGSSGGPRDQPFYFNNGDPYKIHRVILMMDQGGAGKSDLLKGNPSINTTTNTASYAHSALEPCYSWNNTYHPLNGSDQVLGYNPAGYPTNIAGFNYFNLGNGFAMPPPDPTNFYTASVNGTAYRGPFTYPHPLVSRVPSAHEPARRQLK